MYGKSEDSHSVGANTFEDSGVKVGVEKLSLPFRFGVSAVIGFVLF